jgi:hypothetical protein
VLTSKNQNLQLSKLVDSTSREFAEFKGKQEIYAEGEDTKILYERFQYDYPDYFSLRLNTFSKWIKTYCNINKYELKETRSYGKTFIYMTK